MPLQFLNMQHKRKIAGLRHYSFCVPSKEKHAEKSNYRKITNQQKSEKATLFPFHGPVRAYNLNLGWLKIFRIKFVLSE